MISIKKCFTFFYYFQNCIKNYKILSTIGQWEFFFVFIWGLNRKSSPPYIVDLLANHRIISIYSSEYIFLLICKRHLTFVESQNKRKKKRKGKCCYQLCSIFEIRTFSIRVQWRKKCVIYFLFLFDVLYSVYCNDMDFFTN